MSAVCPEPASSDEPVLVSVERIEFAYRRGARVIGDLSAQFSARRVHAITGPSGCGKSTLLYVVGLMLRPSRGEIRLHGVDFGSASEGARAATRAAQIGFIFQDALLEPSMTVAGNILDGWPLKRSRRRPQSEIDGFLERLGLSGLAGKKAAQLSGGQAQRVAVARALLKAPSVVLADEPTGNLDDDSAQIVLDELFTYGRGVGRTTIIVTHDERVAARADTVLRMVPLC